MDIPVKIRLNVRARSGTQFLSFAFPGKPLVNTELVGLCVGAPDSTLQLVVKLLWSPVEPSDTASDTHHLGTTWSRYINCNYWR